MAEITLHGMSGSGNSHKMRLLLDRLRLPYEWVKVNLLEGETRTD